MTSQKLTQAIALIKTGDKQTAYPLMKELVQEEPQNEQVWLWMYVCVDRLEQKKYCLQKALEINPENKNARTALDKLVAVPPAASSVRSDGNVQQPVVPTPPRETPSRQALTALPRQNGSVQKVAHSTQKKNKPNRLILWLGGGVIFSIVCLVVVFIGGRGIYNNFFASTNSENGGGELPSMFSSGDTNNDGGNQPAVDGLPIDGSGIGVDPFADTANNYDEESGVFILDYGRLIPIPVSQLYPSENAPVTVSHDIVFIIKDQYWYEFSLAEYKDGILQNQIPFETVEVQGTGSAYRFEVKDVNDGIYCFALKTSEGIPDRDIWCFLIGESNQVEELIASQRLDIRVLPISYTKTDTGFDPNWSYLSFSLALENYSSEAVLTAFGNQFQIKTQQGFEYTCYLSSGIAPITPPNFRQKLVVDNCRVPTDSSGYEVHTTVKIKKMTPGFDFRYWEPEETYEYNINIEQFNTAITFPIIDGTLYADKQTLLYGLNQPIDLADATVAFAPAIGSLEDGSEALSATVQNNITGDEVIVDLEGIVVLNNGFAKEFIYTIFVNIGSSKQVNLVDYLPSGELNGSCTFISGLTLGYVNSTKENNLLPNYYFICF